jgi:ABC-type multidrug transport system ATPase subunit
LITDHNYREVLDTCDHSYVLHDGVIITEGDKEQILNNASCLLKVVQANALPYGARLMRGFLDSKPKILRLFKPSALSKIIAQQVIF